MAYQLILTEARGRVGVVTLNRPQALNALNRSFIGEITDAVAGFDADDGIGAILLAGSERAFAAGADIKEMADPAFAASYFEVHAGALEKIAATRKPLIAAVSGFALGGGMELAMIADIVIAADTARFGQPEITLGVIPGMGGTQRLPRAIGKAWAFDLILTGRQIDAAEAARIGLVSRVVAAAELATAAQALAEQIAAQPLPALIAAKQAINAAYAMPLADGIRTEQRLFHGLFSTEDQKEGMAAFIARRAAAFRHR
ncbi:MAG TPA: enoyl-CoA hydratase-related protein [Bauldia sp.]|nr:enoyl-CoA hydratase-related protein [Bauldia sp.]